MFKERLKREQPRVYQVLENALLNDRLAHAYMFVGDQNTPKKETAMLLAQSLVCQSVGFADETCDTCQRIMHHNYADFIYLDGTTTSIKKDDVIKLKEEFAKTNLESVGMKIYIIDHAENTTPSALNSLLTFLEEPTSPVMAILLVEHPDQLLDTIKSRCQMIHFHKQKDGTVFDQLKEEMDAYDAYLLSHMQVDLSNIIAIEESDEYQHARYLFETFVKKISNRDRDVNVLIQQGFAKGKRDVRLVAKYMFEMLVSLGKDKLMQQHTGITSYDQLLDAIDDLLATKFMVVCNQMKDKNRKGVNIALLMDEFLYEMEV
ncbi:DNA polymerase-3 subunit delta' [Breznakia blatticola]|uniref:DNA polymerase-3 subunit delta n=1 Tax=Breznakia blatticola TaxID=1754012 RepID=A0A4R7ZS77_9FIRM|nr:DNA polymerase III subunit delta [Breznakia blatticola]TDW20622.1 DNA polymerase-3 subunit delta' [Breznakia blatticola]